MPDPITAAELHEIVRPKRCYTLTIEIGADTWQDVVHDLLDLARHIPDHGPACSSVMGGPSGGHIVTVEHRPEQTHERYIEQLNAYLEQRKATKGATDAN